MEVSDYSEKNTQLPHPPRFPYFGNIFNMSSSNPVQNMMGLIKKYGKNFGLLELAFPMVKIIVLSKFEFIKEVCDETRFDKNVSRPLLEVRDFSGDGLFTAWTNEKNWQKAHNILLPGLGARAMKGYYPMMLDIAERLLAKWHNIPEGKEFNLTTEMTRLTFDTIGLCGFDYRFHSFASEEPHPFIDAMVNALEDSMQRMVLMPFQRNLRPAKDRKYRKSVAYMNQIVDDIIKERKEDPKKYASKADFMSLMMNATDKSTGEKLDDINIRYQILTFLIAGHETTSGLLSFAFYYLMKNPDILKKAYLEIDTVLGTDLDKKPTYQQVNDLKYIQQILLESLRLWPTAPAFSLYPLENTTLAGKYPLKKNQPLIVLIPALHRDKEIWGEKADEFNPDNFLPEAIENRDTDAYKPFGNGQRACIGRQFAMLEATLLMGLVLQKYKLKLTDNYEFKVKETLTLKPDELFVSLELRKDSEKTFVEPVAEMHGTAIKVDTQIEKHLTPFCIAFGSNMGASEDFAIRIAQDAEKYGFLVQNIALDNLTENIPQQGVLVIITSTYNGTPPDNARKFNQWITTSGNVALKNLKYTVFGCGNTQWKTFQEFPRFIDRQLEEIGLQRIYKIGEADASADFDDDFELWYKDFWPTILQTYQLGNTVSLDTKQDNLYQIEIMPDSYPHRLVMPSRIGVGFMKVLANRELQSTPERSTKHVEIELPKDINYLTGDHLLVYPENDIELVDKIAEKFKLNPQTVIRIKNKSAINSHLPIGQEIRVGYLLTNFVELQELATKRQLQVLADITDCPPEKIRLMRLCEDSEAGNALYKSEIFDKKMSIYDVLLENPACEISFGQYLEMLPALKPRYFSISSSSEKYPNQCNITVSVLKEPAYSGKGIYKGVCTNYLANLAEGSFIQAMVKDNSLPFRLPEGNKPVIMVAAGTGIAPFIGFLQERECRKTKGQEIGEGLLFFGCRHPEKDFIYSDELKSWESKGIVNLKTSFSRVDEVKKYVQHVILENQEEVWNLIQKGAGIYICGDANGMANEVKNTFKQIYQYYQKTDGDGSNKWMNELLENQRYMEDVWTGH